MSTQHSCFNYARIRLHCFVPRCKSNFALIQWTINHNQGMCYEPLIASLQTFNKLSFVMHLKAHHHQYKSWKKDFSIGCLSLRHVCAHEETVIRGHWNDMRWRRYCESGKYSPSSTVIAFWPLFLPFSNNCPFYKGFCPTPLNKIVLSKCFTSIYQLMHNGVALKEY